MQRPIIGIPMGDPAGIGPEIVLKALQKEEIYRFSRPLVIGDLDVLRKIDGIIRTGLELNPVSEPEQGRYRPGSVDGCVTEKSRPRPGKPLLSIL